MMWQAVICASAATLFIGAKLGTVCVNEWRRVQLESLRDKHEELERDYDALKRDFDELMDIVESYSKADGCAAHTIFNEQGTRIGVYREKWCRIGMRMYMRKEGGIQ